MPNPLNQTNIIAPRVPLIDERTGLISREWYRFFLNLFVLTGSGANDTSLLDLQVGPPTQPQLDYHTIDPTPASFAAYAAGSAQESQIAELQKQVEALALDNCCAATIAELAEIQKQLQALNLMPQLPPAALTNGSSILYGDNLGGFSNVTIGTGVSFSAGTLSATGTGGTVTSVTGTSPVVSSGGTTPAISLAAGYGDTLNPYASKTANYVLAAPNGSAGVPTFRALVAADIPALPYGTGTVTSVSIVSANGFAGTVATATTTPAITLTTTITGLIKGNGTAISAATANTDYQGVAAPVTKTADFTVANGDVWYINNKSGSTCVVTLPAASSWSGRTLTFKNMQAQLLNSASSNVVPLDSTTAGTSILLNVIGNWATMVSDGTNWVIMQAAANNNLLLE